MRAAVGFALLLVACNAAGTPGSGKPAHETRAVSPFTKIDAGGVFELSITRGTLQVELDGDDNLLPKVTTNVHDGRLELRTDGNVRPKLPLHVTIRMPRINELSLGGAGKAQVTDIIGDDLALYVTGAGTVTAAGTINRIDAKVSGAGTIDARALLARHADAHVSGSGTIDVAADEDLTVDISGAGSVHYAGNPRIKKTINGAGTIAPL